MGQINVYKSTTYGFHFMKVGKLVIIRELINYTKKKKKRKRKELIIDSIRSSLRHFPVVDKVTLSNKK